MEDDICGGDDPGCGQTGNVRKGLTTITNNTGNNEEKDELDDGESGHELIENIENSDANDGPECVFYRGNCKQHKIKGDKTVVKVKKWVKKKNGFGWLTTNVTKYTCPRRNLPQNNRPKLTSGMDSRSPDLNFVNFGTECRKFGGEYFRRCAD